jgi:chromosome segregation ATPase
MDPVSAFGLASSMVAIFDGLKEAYRFGREVIRADNDRKDFNSRLEYVETVMMSVATLIEAEKAHPGQAWLLLLNPDDNTKSPLKGLELAVKSMNTALMDKKTAWRQKLRNFEWPSEKKKLESHFTAVDGFCAGIVTILTTAGISLQRENLILSKEINVTGQTLAIKLEESREETKEINLTTQVLAAKFDEGQEETREINLTTKALAAKFEETREETKEIKLITKSLAAKFEEDRAETQKAREKAEKLQAENQKRQEELEKKDIEHWLSPFDFQAQQREKLEDAAPSGKLFVESPEFRNWKSGDVQHLRCYGPSGAGKVSHAHPHILLVTDGDLADNLICHCIRTSEARTVT